MRSIGTLTMVLAAACLPAIAIAQSTQVHGSYQPPVVIQQVRPQGQQNWPGVQGQTGWPQKERWPKSSAWSKSGWPSATTVPQGQAQQQQQPMQTPR
jgi:hypothetical protein